MIASALDAVPGLGQAKRKALLDSFGSVKSVKAAPQEELARVRGIGPVLAAAVFATLHPADGAPEAQPGINMTTGEILQS